MASPNHSSPISHLGLTLTPTVQLCAQVYASADAEDKFVVDFVRAWCKVMDVDRFDLNAPNRDPIAATAAAAKRTCIIA